MRIKSKHFKFVGNNVHWWKPIKGFDGYFVCEDGRIASTKQTGGHIAYLYELTPLMQRGGKRYKERLQVKLYKEGKSFQRYVARLVAEAFIPNPENKPEVHHIDGNPLNNDVSNLMWVTHEEHIALHKLMREARKHK